MHVNFALTVFALHVMLPQKKNELIKLNNIVVIYKLAVCSVITMVFIM